jgi:hypothetical protein
MIKDKVNQQLNEWPFDKADPLATQFATGDRKNLELLLKKYKATIEAQLKLPKTMDDYRKANRNKEIITLVNDLLYQITK